MKIAIRAEGGPATGMGHIVRCLSLANEFRKQSQSVIFISNDPVGRNAIAEQGFEAVSVMADELDNPEDFLSILKRHAIDCLIVDYYRVNRDYFLRLKEGVKCLCYVDDLNKFTYPVDILINGNFAAELMGYEKYSPDEVLLLGVSYNFIREEFRDLPPRKVNKEIERILITTGGADPSNLTSRLISELKTDDYLNHIHLDVVVGGGFIFKDELYKQAKIFQGVTLHENVKRISELMLKSDAAISAGGSTLYELCACGVPAFVCIIADNQEYIVTKLAENNFIRNLGWHDRVDFTVLKQMIRDLTFKDREIWVEKMQKLVDARGTERVVEAILKYCN